MMKVLSAGDDATSFIMASTKFIQYGIEWHNLYSTKHFGYFLHALTTPGEFLNLSTTSPIAQHRLRIPGHDNIEPLSSTFWMQSSSQIAVHQTVQTLNPA